MSDIYSENANLCHFRQKNVQLRDFSKENLRHDTRQFEDKDFLEQIL